MLIAKSLQSAAGERKYRPVDHSVGVHFGVSTGYDDASALEWQRVKGQVTLLPSRRSAHAIARIRSKAPAPHSRRASRQAVHEAHAASDGRASGLGRILERVVLLLSLQ